MRKAPAFRRASTIRVAAGFLALALLILPAPRALAGFLFVSSTATNQILRYDDCPTVGNVGRVNG
jgi:hypothetical protein